MASLCSNSLSHHLKVDLSEAFHISDLFVELKLYDVLYGFGSTMYEILSSLVVKPEMEPSTILLPRLEALEVICLATEKNQKMFVKVTDLRWWSNEEENERQKQGRRSLSRIKRSVLMNVHAHWNMFCCEDVDVLRAQGMSIELLAPFDGTDYLSYTSNMCMISNAEQGIFLPDTLRANGLVRIFYSIDHQDWLVRKMFMYQSR